MAHDLRLGEEFFALLVELDAEIARMVAMAECRHCGGRLYQANYPRKLRGAEIAGAAEAFALRHLLCCDREGCRRRALPPSLRFLGRRVYVEAVVLAASVVALLVPALAMARSLTGVPAGRCGAGPAGGGRCFRRARPGWSCVHGSRRQRSSQRLPPSANGCGLMARSPWRQLRARPGC